ncbi:MAG: RsmE family RNA methyltransferase [Ktedonobacterales bacterium]
MSAGRFYIADLTPETELELPAEIAHQARGVLRLVPGNVLSLLDGAGGVYEAQLLAMTRNRVLVRLGQRRLVNGLEPAVRLVLCQGMLKAAKYEVVLQKCTELGVASFVPMLSERAVAATPEASDLKQRRWARIVSEAMEQCGGTHLPELSEPQSLQQALHSLPPGGIALVPWEEEQTSTLRGALATALSGRVLREVPEIRLFVGPEGGFSAGEVAVLRQHAAIPVTLGRRILRSETAAIVAVTLTLDALGSFEAHA